MLDLTSGVTGFANSIQKWPTGVTAGLVGGAAEILWIAIYMHLVGGEATVVARGITESVFPNLVTPATAVPLGIAIHMGLAVMLGVAIFIFVRSLLPRTAPALLEPLVLVGLLVCVWVTNFFLILPAINPAFVALVPYSASLFSKVLFGVAAALVLKLYDGFHLASKPL